MCFFILDPNTYQFVYFIKQLSYCQKLSINIIHFTSQLSVTIDYLNLNVWHRFLKKY